MLRLARLERAVTTLQATAVASAAAPVAEEIPAEILVEIHLAVLGLLPEQRAAAARAPAPRPEVVPAQAIATPLLVAPLHARPSAFAASAWPSRPGLRPERLARSARRARAASGLPRKRAREARAPVAPALVAPRVAVG